MCYIPTYLPLGVCYLIHPGNLETLVGYLRASDGTYLPLCVYHLHPVLNPILEIIKNNEKGKKRGGSTHLVEGRYHQKPAGSPLGSLGFQGGGSTHLVGDRYRK